MGNVKRTWRYGYVVLPIFAVRELEGTFEPELICSPFLQWLFDKVFRHFWNGTVWFTHEITEGGEDE